MKQIPAILLFSFFTTIVCGQKMPGKNTAYLELGGNGLISSVNYERQLTNHPALAIHVGVGTYITHDDKFKFFPTIPVGINYLLKLNKRSMLDIGFGATWTKPEVKLYAIVDRYYNYVNHDYINFVPSVGYRHHTKNNLMWRCSITPIITHSIGVIPFVGFSFGKIF
ncbi:MAG: hypothetical protein ABI402_12245 [Ferruginibacter sp.]